MFTALLLGLAAQTVAAPPPAPGAAVTDPRLTRMAALYEELCLKAFPDDAAVDRLMAARGATALTPEQVRVTLVDDPGRGWRVADAGGPVLVILELPPYHACSVRWDAPAGTPDWSAYRAVSDPYLAGHDGWTTLPPMEMDRGDIHISGVTTARMTAAGSDALIVVDQTPSDPAKRGTGTVDRRLVHQMQGH
ncbi:NMCC_0638 family (lipo)protein [Sphingomonas sp.]|uniref:NMCC_0638 family (lipo)protein n=1 Tax=Sphingomonas sp. TaxID=28214 RepID=UPI003CC6A5FA